MTGIIDLIRSGSQTTCDYVSFSSDAANDGDCVGIVASGDEPDLSTEPPAEAVNEARPGISYGGTTRASVRKPFNCHISGYSHRYDGGSGCLSLKVKPAIGSSSSDGPAAHSQGDFHVVHSQCWYPAHHVA
jgi:hypothetical protein